MDVKVRDGNYYCPECNSKKVAIMTRNTLIKMRDANTGKPLNPETLKMFQSIKEKARAYDQASMDEDDQWYFQCRRCGWESDKCYKKDSVVSGGIGEGPDAGGADGEEGEK